MSTQDTIITAAREQAKRWIRTMYGKGPMLPGHEIRIESAAGRKLTDDEWTLAREAFASELDRLRPSEGVGSNARRCPDDGTCHHACEPGQCFRVACCSPLTAAGWGDEWPAEIKVRYGSEARP